MSEPRPTLWPWLQAVLQEALGQLHSHAVLLHGPEGVGQFEFALDLARAWLCEARPAGQGHAPACGRCASCHLIEAGSHPDLMVVLPGALQASLAWQHGGGGDEGESSEKSGGKTKKLSQEIKVDAVRAIVQFSQHTASRGRAKVVLVHPAERMNLIAANTLLKTLEEPPGQVRFVLSGAALDQLLPTVRSRCQAWRLPLPAPEVAASWLQTQLDVPAQDARMLLDAAGGQPLTARDRHQLGLDARYWPQIPKDLQGGAATALTQWPLTLVVETLQKVCHDLACVAAGAAPRYFPAASLPPVSDLHLLTTWAQELRKASRHAEHPWNNNLKVEALLLQARAVMKPRQPRGNPHA